MRRREFFALLGSAVAAWPIAGRSQPTAGAKRRVGALIIYAETNPDSHKVRKVLEQSLKALGWKIGQNLDIDYRFGIAERARARDAVADLIALRPDLIFANSVAATRAATQATRDIPIVFNGVSEPVRLGFVSSLSHPGRNVTGFSNLEPSVGGKWLELLKTVAPQITHVTIMFNPSSTKVAEEFAAATATAASHFGITAVEARVHEPADIDKAMKRIGEQLGGSLITPPDTFLGLHFREVVQQERRWRLPAIHPFRYFVDAGSLMSYGPDVEDQFRQAALYINRILHGESPADLPVQQPTKFEFVINLKAAKVLRLNVPSSVLATADEVIE